MLEELLEKFESIPATAVGGICRVASYMLSEQGMATPVDLAWVTVLLSGTPIVYSAIRKLFYNQGISRISSALLITIAMIASIAIGDLFAAGEVAFIMAIGEILEDKTTERAQRGLHKLMSLAPVQGRRLVNGREEIIATSAIVKGDLLRVLPGETIPVDGIIRTGETTVNQAVMTGESLPVDKGEGDTVYCGTINCFGAIDMVATKVGEDSSLQRLIRLVQQAEVQQAPMQRIADKAASWLVPAALAVALLAGWYQQDVVVAVTVLVVFCPCALVLATPTAIMAAIGQATKHGVIIKSGEALEKMQSVDVVAFDKTGTLTQGKLAVSDVVALESAVTQEELLAAVAAVEVKSEHPLGKAVVAYAKEQGVQVQEGEDFQMTAGRGVMATLDGKNIICGNEHYLREHGIALSPMLVQKLASLRREGKATLVVGMDGNAVGVIALSDVVRPQATATIAKLASMGTEAVLLTGDNAQAALYLAEQVGINNVLAELLPQDKVKAVEALQKDGRKVCMLGDGVNDAPALKTAAVGVAMGCMGSDIAVEAADIALMDDDISKVAYLKRLAQATVATIKFSIALSLLINFVAVTMSVMHLLNPTTGALVHNLGSFVVILIAAMLYDRKLI